MARTSRPRVSGLLPVFGAVKLPSFKVWATVFEKGNELTTRERFQDRCLGDIGKASALERRCDQQIRIVGSQWPFNRHHNELVAHLEFLRQKSVRWSEGGSLASETDAGPQAI
jgi:hypothetical protein